MSAEAVARVVRDIKDGRGRTNGTIGDSVLYWLQLLANKPETAVIDATPMYQQITSGDDIDLYADFVVLPVWDSALIGYENQHGNVNVIQTFHVDKDDPIDDRRPPGVRWGRWASQNEIDWQHVAHQYMAALWIGGRSPLVGPLPTFGPVMRFDVATYEDGTIADIHWTQLYDLKDGDPETFSQNAIITWLQTYTLAGCTNVELVTPQRPKPERKRIARLGNTPQTLVIKKTSKSYRHTEGTPLGGDVPQSFVKGHYARYGPEHGRGLLFGKYAGKFWIPAHARGEGERPEREIDYVTDPGPA